MHRLAAIVAIAGIIAVHQLEAVPADPAEPKTGRELLANTAGFCAAAISIMQFQASHQYQSGNDLVGQWFAAEADAVGLEPETLFAHCVDALHAYEGITIGR